MRYMITAMLFAYALDAQGQKIETGVNVGFNYLEIPKQKKTNDFGFTGSVQALVKLNLFKIGLFGEVGSLNGKYTTYEPTYDPVSGQVKGDNKTLRNSIARPYFVGGILANVSGGRFYSGFLVGYGKRSPEVEYFNYDTTTKKTDIQVYRAGVSYSVIMLGTHFGYTYYLKKIGFNAEAGIRYMIMGPRYDFAPRYNAFFFPITVGVRYRL